MGICHLYDTQSYNHIQKILTSFEKSDSKQLSTVQSLEDYEIYIIELNETNKETSLQLKNLFKSKHSSLIYLIVPESYTLMFFQLSYLLGTKDLIIRSQDPEKIVNRLMQDKKNHIDKIFEKFLVEQSTQNQSFLFYKNKQLKKITPKLFHMFQYKNSSEFIENIIPQIDLKNLLDKDTEIEKKIKSIDDKAYSYKIKSVSINENQKIIYFDKNVNVDKHLTFISSRVTFIELLKSKYIQSSIAENNLSAITINIKNLADIKKNLSTVEYEYLLIDFLSFMTSTLEQKIIFSEIDKNFYIVLFENISYEKINETAIDFHTKMLNYIAKQENKPYLDIYTLNLSSITFNEVFKILERIFHQNLSYEDKTSLPLTHISNKQDVISEKDLLDEIFKNGTEFKLLNIYNGLVIKTASKIFKITKDSIYVHFESLQGVVLNLEKQTILQSPSFMQDIQAEVKVIDLRKKIAILEKFKFLKTNPNTRQYSRVTMSNQSPILLRLKNYTLNGFILDLSIKSIAIKTKYNENIDSLKTQNIRLIFNIPGKRYENGYLKVEIESTVITTTIPDTDNNCKIICDLDENSTDISNLMEFIYERQKDLIIELKKRSKLN